jgi:hypothetical protein
MYRNSSGQILRYSRIVGKPAPLMVTLTLVESGSGSAAILKLLPPGSNTIAATISKK